MSGRIVYKKVLGEKNPAELLTKHMSAELAGRHIETLNMKWAGGRAESAPTIDAVSMVQGWYVNDSDLDAMAGEQRQVRRRDENVRVERRVHFSDVVGVRPIAASGRGRRTPLRGKSGIEGKWRREASGVHSLARGKVSNVRSEIEGAIDESTTYDCGHQPLPSLSDGARAWADMDEDDTCECCRQGWQTAIRGRRAGANRAMFNDREGVSRKGRPGTSDPVSGEARARVNAGAHDERPIASLEIVETDIAHSSVMHVNDCARAGMYRFCRMSGMIDACSDPSRCMSTVSFDSPGACKPEAGMTCDPMCDRLSGGNLEAVCPVPAVHRRSDSIAPTVRDHFGCSGNSDGSQSPRRSAGSGPVEQCDHACRHVRVCADTRVRHGVMCRHRRARSCVRRNGMQVDPHPFRLKRDFEIPS